METALAWNVELFTEHEMIVSFFKTLDRPWRPAAFALKDIVEIYKVDRAR